jgi:miniconductance mechanosensitive channel
MFDKTLRIKGGPDWEPYESLQSDMLDHAYGVLPLFGLRCWQRPWPGLPLQ